MSIRVCSVATTAVAAGVALCGKVIYTALSCVCHRGRLEQPRLLRTAELALDTKVTHDVFPRNRPSSDAAAVCVVSVCCWTVVRCVLGASAAWTVSCVLPDGVCLRRGVQNHFRQHVSDKHILSEIHGFPTGWACRENVVQNGFAHLVAGNSIREHTRNCPRSTIVSPSTQQTTVQQHTATTHTAAVSVLAYTHRSSTAAASLLGLLLGNTPCATFMSRPSSAGRSSRSCSSLPRWQTQERAV